MPSMTLLNEHGDITIEWDEHNEAEIRSMVEAKMKEGVKFYIVKRKLGVFNTKTPLKNSSDIKGRGKVVLVDSQVESLVKRGIARLGKYTSKTELVGIAKTVDEVVKNNTVASRPAVGA